MYVTHMTELCIAIILTVYVLVFKIPVLKKHAVPFATSVEKIFPRFLTGEVTF